MKSDRKHIERKESDNKKIMKRKEDEERSRVEKKIVVERREAFDHDNNDNDKAIKYKDKKKMGKKKREKIISFLLSPHRPLLIWVQLSTKHMICFLMPKEKKQQSEPSCTASEMVTYDLPPPKIL